MGHDQFTYELSLGKEKILISGTDEMQLLKHSWDEKRHCNADWELHLILKGNCQVDVEDEHLRIQAGQVIVIAPGQYHRPKALPGEFERFSFSFSAQKSLLASQLYSRVPASRVIDVDEAFCATARSLALESASNRAFRRNCCKAMLTQLIIWLFRCLDITDSTQIVPRKTSTNDLTQLIDTYFEQHFADASGEKALADILHISRRHLIRVLQENYGMTFRQKLIHARMDYAAWLLRTTQMKISRISSTVGYSSEAAFFRVFRQNFGITPKQYRAKKKTT